MEYLVKKCMECGTPQYPVASIQPCEVGCFPERWNFWCQKHDRPSGPQGCDGCAYPFEGQTYFEPDALGEALFARWTAGERQTVRQRVSDWLLDSGRDRVLAGRVREVERTETLAPEDRYALVVTLLHGDAVLRWRGEIVNTAWLRERGDQGLALLRGPVAAAMSNLGLGTWLRDLQADWREIMAELPAPDAEEAAFGLLFKQRAARDLVTALRVAVVVPRLHQAGQWEARANRHLVKLAASVSEYGFVAPASARLKELFLTLVQGLRAGVLSVPDNRCFYECTLILAWRYEGRTLLENGLFRDALTAHLRANTDRRLLQSLVYGYFRDFTLRLPDFINAYATLIRGYLDTSSLGDFMLWRDRDAAWGMFAGADAPALCAPRLQVHGPPAEALQGLGLLGANLWGGFSAELLLAWLGTLAGYSLTQWLTIRGWFEKVANPAFADRQHNWIDAVVRPWIGRPASASIRIEVGRYLVDRFGEPADSAPVWVQCRPEVRDTVKQWLFLGNLEAFFELIADYAETTGGEMRSQWAYRKAFWLAVHRTNAVTDLCVAVGDGILATYGMARLKDRFGSKLARLDDTDERRCALILRIGDLTAVDFTHNAKCRIWQTSERQIRWFSQARLSRREFRDHKDLLLRAHYTEPGISHFTSENYGWQDALADFLRLRSVVRLARRDYEWHDRV